MLAATGIAIFIIPALYVIVERLSSMGKHRVASPVDIPEPTPVHGD